MVCALCLSLCFVFHLCDWPFTWKKSKINYASYSHFYVLRFPPLSALSVFGSQWFSFGQTQTNCSLPQQQHDVLPHTCINMARKSPDRAPMSKHRHVYTVLCMHYTFTYLMCGPSSMHVCRRFRATHNDGSTVWTTNMDSAAKLCGFRLQISLILGLIRIQT